MALPKFDYFAPETLESAISLLEQHGEGAYVLAGGTDLLVKMTLGRLKPKTVIGLQGIGGIDRIDFNANSGLIIGAMARLVDVGSHPAILEYYPALAYAAQVMANVQVRNMGTVAGNLCNAAPSAENAPPLMALSAEVVLTGIKGERKLPLDMFFKGPGITAREPGEIMTAIHVPVPQTTSANAYKRISARCGVDIAAVCVGVMVDFHNDVCKEARIALGAVAPVPMRAEKTEALLRGRDWSPELVQEAAVQASEEAKPISDVRATAEYRKIMVAVLTRRALEEARNRIETRRSGEKE